MSSRRLKVGTRRSKLALVQTQFVTEMLSRKVPGLEIQVVEVSTLGDRLPPKKRGETDGKGAYTGDIESLLLRGDLDFAVHSLKDLSLRLDGRLKIAATPPRGDPRDALVSTGGKSFAELGRAATLGTSSVRRRAQILGLRGDLRIVELHGNVETRVRKMEALGLDGVVLAAAGLDRLMLGSAITQRFSTDELVPAAGQGTLAVEIRKDDVETERIVSKINDDSTMLASVCELAFAVAAGGDCNSPVGAYAVAGGRSLALTGMIASTDGKYILTRTMNGAEAEELGITLAKEMLQVAGAAVLGRAGA